MMMQSKVIGSSIRIPKYGYLYNEYALQGTSGGSITSSDTWKSMGIYPSSGLQVLISYIGNDTTFLGVKSTGTTYWNSPNTGALNLHNFNLHGSGSRSSVNGSFNDLKVNAILACYPTFTYTNNYTSGANNGYTVPGFRTGRSVRLFRAVGADSIKSDGAYCDDYIGNDGQAYKTVKIGTQVWTVENLCETKYRDLSTIPTVTDGGAWIALTTGAKCAYNNDESNVFL